jgi:hypothetical protein
MEESDRRRHALYCRIFRMTGVLSQHSAGGWRTDITEESIQVSSPFSTITIQKSDIIGVKELPTGLVRGVLIIYRENGDQEDLMIAPLGVFPSKSEFRELVSLFIEKGYEVEKDPYDSVL